MNQLEQFRETAATYRKHGWRLERVLMSAETLAQLKSADQVVAHFEDVVVQESPMDALWFARPSHEGREAWELRYISEMPYALFELFASDCGLNPFRAASTSRSKLLRWFESHSKIL